MTEDIAPEIKMAASPSLLARGCVHVLGLNCFKENAGPRWEKMRETIYTRTESVLSHKLGPSDFFVRLNEIAYLITMPSSEPEDAKICCLRIAHDLHTSLLGSCNAKDIALYVAKDNGADSFELSRIVEPELGHLAHNAGLKDLVPADDAVRARHEPHHPLKGDRNFLHAFLPIWDVRKEAITTYRILSKREMGIANYAGGNGVLREEISLAKASILHATEVLARHLELGERFLMIVPVPHDVLASPIGRMEIGSLCRNLSSEFRPFLIIEISDVPAGVPQSRLNDLVTIVKPFCKAVMTKISLRERNYSSYQGIGITCFGIILPRHELTLSQIHEEITRLAEAGKRMNLMTFLGNVSSPDLVGYARDAGINLVAGSAVELPRQEPLSMHRLNLADLLRPRLVAAG